MRLLSLFVVFLFVAPAAASATSPGRDGNLLVHFENEGSSSQAFYPSSLVAATPEGGVARIFGECPAPLTPAPQPLCAAAYAEWSPSGKRFAFTGEGVSVARSDGSGLRAVTTSDGTYFDRHPTWSPDGRSLAFVRENRLAADPSTGVGSTDVYVVRSDGTGLRQLTTSGKNFDVAWSSRGELAIAQNPASGARILKVDSRGRHARVLYRGSFSTIDWRPDGNVLTFTRDVGGTRRDGIWAVGRNGGRPRLQAPGLRDAFWSPSGKYMAAYDDAGFVRARANGSRREVVDVPYRHPSRMGTYAQVLAWQPLPRR